MKQGNSNGNQEQKRMEDIINVSSESETDSEQERMKDIINVSSESETDSEQPNNNEGNMNVIHVEESTPPPPNNPFPRNEAGNMMSIEELMAKIRRPRDQSNTSVHSQLEGMFAQIAQQLRARQTIEYLQNPRCKEAICAYLRGKASSQAQTSVLRNMTIEPRPSATPSSSQVLDKRDAKGKGVVDKRDAKGKGVVGEEQTRDKVTSSHSVSSIFVDRSTFTFETSADEVNLREWLDAGGNEKDKFQTLLLFNHVLEFVDCAHSQGLVLRDFRPSNISISTLNEKIIYRGTFVKKKLDFDLNEEALNSKTSMEEDMNDVSKPLKVSIENIIPLRQVPCDSQGSGYIVQQHPNLNNYPSASVMRQNTMTQFSEFEQQLYTSLEEIRGQDCTASSNIYGLGVLLFELLISFYKSSEERDSTMSFLRRAEVPLEFWSHSPSEAEFCVWLLHPEPSSRPTTSEILQSEFIAEVNKRQNARLSVIESDLMETDILLDFLLTSLGRKKERAASLAEDIKILDQDIEEAKKRYSSSDTKSLSIPVLNNNNLMKNISHLEEVYFSSRRKIHQPDSSRNVENEVMEDVGNEVMENSDDPLGDFFEGLTKHARYSKFEVCGTLNTGDLVNSSNRICSMSFNRDEQYIAVAGSRELIKIFELQQFMDDNISYPVATVPSMSSLTSVCWNKYIQNYLVSAHNNGTIRVWDACTGQIYSDLKEHLTRVLSLDFSSANPRMFASGSDDNTIKLWSLNQTWSTGSIYNQCSVCSVQFYISSSHMLAIGSADYMVRCYDLRRTLEPVCTLTGHRRPVSYVQFVDSETIASASTDNSIKLWDLKKAQTVGYSSGDACINTLKGHRNERCFVGLANFDGYIASGSETNEVYSYYKSLPMPIASHKFGPIRPLSGLEWPGSIVSSVLWSKSNRIVAANSAGTMKLLKMS